MNNEFTNDFVEFLEETKSVADIPVQICHLLQADDCVIWKPSKRLEFGKPLDDPQKCRLYPLTSTFGQENGLAHSGLPLDFKNDFTGRTYLAGWNQDLRALPLESRRHQDFPSLDRDCMSAKFMQSRKLRKIAVSLFSFVPDVAPYAISVYRGRQKESDFTDAEIARLDDFARLIPLLVDRHTKGHLIRLLEKVHEALRPPRPMQSAAIPSPENTLSALCIELSKAFHCAEVTLILGKTSTSATPKSFQIQASSIKDIDDKTGDFIASKSDGLTGYVLETCEDLEFHDLRNFLDPAMRTYIEEKHIDIVWRDRSKILDYSRKHFENKLVNDIPPPPVTFLGIPIFGPSDQPALFGMIRCSIGLNPYFFLPAEKEVLKLVASSIGHWWADYLLVNTEVNRAGLLHGLIEVYGALQDSIRRAIDEDPLGEDALRASKKVSVIENTWKAIQSKVPNVTLVCFRRYQESSGKLVIEHIASTKGVSNWMKGVDAESSEYPLIRSLLTTHNGKQEGLWLSSEEIQSSGTFIEKAQLYLGLAGSMAIRVAITDRLIGILDIGFSTNPDEPLQNAEITRLMHSLAKQLSLYEQVKVYQKRLKKSVDDQILMTQSVGHQIKSPLANAREVLDLIYSPIEEAKYHPGNAAGLGKTLERIIPKQLPRLSGMVQKAQSVGRFMELFGKLSRNQSLGVKIEKQTRYDFARSCWEIYKNNVVTEESEDMEADEPRNLEFTGMIAGYRPRDYSSPLRSYDMYYNRQAMEQVLDAIFSNALKYGRSGSTVKIDGFEKGGEFCVSIVNQADTGFELSELDAKKCRDEGYRSPKCEAKIGSGLGLWIAHRLMQEQHGAIEPSPTDKDGFTKFTLKFSWNRSQ